MQALTVPAGFDLPHPTTQNLELMMRTLACPLFRWLIVARCQLGLHRQYEAEFPAAIAHPLEWISRSSRAAGRASLDALRLIHHQKFTKDKHEILYIREKFARARAFPPPRRRWPGASIFRRQSGATEERILWRHFGVGISTPLAIADAKAAPQKKGFWSRIADFFATPDKSAVKTEQSNGFQSRSQTRTP